MAETALNCKIEGRGPRLVLLHPVGLDLACWDDVAAILTRSYTVLRLDLPGHGASPPAVKGATLADYADDVHGLLIARGFAPAAVVGLSFGGMIAQVLTVRHPADVDRLVVCGCPSTLPDAARKMMAERADRSEITGMAGVIEETLQRWFTPAFIAAGGAEPTRRRLLADDVHGWSAGWRAISGLDIQPHLHQIAVPALCIAGELDPASPPAALAAIAERIPGAGLTVLAGAPHMMQIERPREFADTVAGFLAAHPPAA